MDAPVSLETGNIISSLNPAGKHRQTRARKDLKSWLDRVGLPYHSPHKFRHGNAVYSLKHSGDIADLKAVSMNLMHVNISITDGVYGVLSQSDVKQRITKLSESKLIGLITNDQILLLAQEILKELNKNL